MNALLATQTQAQDPTKPKIIIIGDVILDHTVQGTVNTIANEAPVPVLKKDPSEAGENVTLGGAANVAANAAACGAITKLYSIVGDDLYGSILRDIIPQDIEAHLFRAPTPHPTTVKHRAFVHDSLLFRYDEESKTIPPHTLDTLYSAVLESIERDRPDAIIFSDYGKGVCANTDYIQKVITAARLNNIPTIVDAKDAYHRYTGATVLKPNRAEAAAYADLPKDTHVGALHQYLYEKAPADYTCITMSEDGVSMYDHKAGIRTEQAVPHKYTVNDVTGAGDVATAVLAYCFATRTPIHHTLYCMSALATISVQHMNTYVLQPADFWTVRRTLNKRLEPHEIPHIPKTLGPIVFTNGCFDMLHAGHIKQLKYAKEQGAILIVAINSDTSVAALKGPSRPIIPQEQRAALIEALECVDYYFIFDELSPAQYIEKIRPAVLVKGADYTVDRISSAVYAGRVELVPLYPGVSTSTIIDRIMHACSQSI
jgi:D-beta-D-heptose 7-phosphate kinase/D-beta-D-heptose 1-phosphate adenosyltransferase